MVETLASSIFYLAITNAISITMSSFVRSSIFRYVQSVLHFPNFVCIHFRPRQLLLTLLESHNHESPSVAVTVTNCLTLATQLLQYYFTYLHDVVSERMSSGKAHTSSLFNSAITNSILIMMSSFVRSSIFHFPVLHFSVPGVGRSFFGLAFSQSIIIRLLFENRWRSERRRRPNSTSAKTYYDIIIIIISPPEQLMISQTNSVSEQP